MAFLFTVEGRAVFPNVETLRTPPFKEIWERDKTKDKNIALQEFTYIEFLTSVKKSNPYRDYEKEDKERIVRKDVIDIKGWKPDKLIFQAMDKIAEFQEKASLTYSYFIAAKELAEKMKTFFRTVDIDERNQKTLNPIYKPKDITNVLNDTERTLTNFDRLEKKVQEELYETSRIKSGKEVSPFAKRSSL